MTLKYGREIPEESPEPVFETYQEYRDWKAQQK